MEEKNKVRYDQLQPNFWHFVGNWRRETNAKRRLLQEFKAKKAAMDRDSKAAAAPADPAVAALRQQQLDLFGRMELEPDRSLGDGDGELARFQRVRRERLEQCANLCSGGPGTKASSRFSPGAQVLVHHALLGQH